LEFVVGFKKIKIAGFYCLLFLAKFHCSDKKKNIQGALGYKVLFWKECTEVAIFRQ
jgi:hypothetical protein